MLRGLFRFNKMHKLLWWLKKVYDMLQKEWPQPHVFHQQFLTPDKVSPRSQWLSRAIGRHGWVIRKSTVSQKVPDNWLEIGGLESVRICETFRLAEIDVLINADETFLRFYPEEEHVIAPEGSKRVGSTNETNDKKGLTAMLGVELSNTTMPNKSRPARLHKSSRNVCSILSTWKKVPSKPIWKL